MSKTITSPVPRWPGSVKIADPLTLPQARLIEEAMAPLEPTSDGRVWFSLEDEKRLPAILGCVEKWELENFTSDPFPGSPRKESHQLVDWIFREILEIYFGESAIPNG